MHCMRDSQKLADIPEYLKSLVGETELRLIILDEELVYSLLAV